MYTRLKAAWACWAFDFVGGVEPLSIFAGWGVVGESAGHATQRHDVVPRQIEEEVSGRFIADSGLEWLLFPPYR